ncbi:spinster family MFS transporter [Sphingomonas canadensis]|uniref:Spinster family MFS transporter n=1 Tax=Sphingomonas canadensis TaxID=1219257 RepID=A0ABW3HEJ9_9SPHN|nr:MFS transporter [Sphingomonas canadensis]MCW3837634.1 MFS transporter [Sphingomonas canadensis]
MSANPSGTPAGGARSPWPWTATWPLFLLTMISVFNYLDRSLLGLALPAIKKEMGSSDTLLGLVSGLAFILFYSVLGVPIAWLADRANRRNIIAAGLAFWSMMTAFTGFVANLWQLALARLLMGAGEACGMPPSNSILADLFKADRRPLALAIFGTASSISSIVFFPIAGWIAQTHGWRAMFMVMGAPGILLAVIFFLTVREPQRLTPPPPRLSLARGLWGDIGALFANRCFAWIFAGVTLMGANVWAAGAWTPTFFVRVHNLGVGEVASIIGPARGFIGLAGILIGGALIDRLPKDRVFWRIGIPAIACLLAGPAEALFLLGNSHWAWVGGFALSSFFTLIHQAPIFAAVVNIVEERRRALAISLVLLGASLIGNALGPSAVGLLNDLLHASFGDHAIRYSMLMIAVTPVLAALCFWRAAVLYAAAGGARDEDGAAEPARGA